MDAPELPTTSEALELHARRLQRLLSEYLLIAAPPLDGPSDAQALDLTCAMYGLGSWQAFCALPVKPSVGTLKVDAGRLSAAITQQFGLNLSSTQLDDLIDEVVIGFHSDAGAQDLKDAWQAARKREAEHQPQAQTAALKLTDNTRQTVLTVKAGRSSKHVLEALSTVAAVLWTAFPPDPSLEHSRHFLEELGELAFSPDEAAEQDAYEFALRRAKQGVLSLLSLTGLQHRLGDNAGSGPAATRVADTGKKNSLGHDPRELLVAAAQCFIAGMVPDSGALGEWKKYTIDRSGETLLAWLLRRIKTRHGMRVVRVHSAGTLVALGVMPAEQALPPVDAEISETELSGLRDLLLKTGFWDHEENRDSPERDAYRQTLSEGAPHPTLRPEQVYQIAVSKDRCGVSAQDLAQALMVARASLVETGMKEKDTHMHPLIRGLIADLLRAELTQDGYTTDDLDPGHLAEDPTFGPGYSLWFGERFEVAYSVTGNGLNLVVHPQGMSPGGRAHLARAEARVIARVTGGSGDLAPAAGPEQ